MGEDCTIEICRRGFRGQAKEAPDRVPRLDQSLESNGRFRVRELRRRDYLGTTTTCEGGLSRCSQVAHPIDRAIGCEQITLSIAFNHGHRRRTRLPTLATRYRDQVHGNPEPD